MSKAYLKNQKLYLIQPEEGGIEVYTKSILRLQDQFLRNTELQGQCSLDELVRCLINLKLIVLDARGTRYAPTGKAPLRQDLVPQIQIGLGQGMGRSVRDLFV